LTGGRFKRHEIDHLWKSIANNSDTCDAHQFISHFDQLNFRGLSSVKTVSEACNTSGVKTISSLPTQSTKFTIQTKTSSSSKWDNNIIEKLRVLVTSSTRSIHDVFAEFDEDGNGTITNVEFRNAIRKLNIGLTSRDIDQLMAKMDTNQDGLIDYYEFLSKFKLSTLDERMQQRTATKMARFKQLMNLHMTSANDAFRFVSAKFETVLTLMTISFSFVV